MTADEIVKDIAVLIAGLQVPISLSMPLGAAVAPWQRLFKELTLAGFGWTDAAQIELALRDRLNRP